VKLSKVLLLNPDWQRICIDLRRRHKWTDQALAHQVEFLGVPCERSTINKLRMGENRSPKYRLGIALLLISLDMHLQWKTV